MTRRSIAERLDDMARLTGIPALTETPPRRRPLRWPATVALAAAVIGFAITLASGRPHWIGFALLMTGFVLGNFMPIFGPLKPWGSLERIDEYDRALRARAFLVAFGVLAATAFAGLWLLVGLSITAGWDVDRLRQMAGDLAFLLAAITTAGPTCYASWAQRPLTDD